MMKNKYQAKSMQVLGVGLLLGGIFVLLAACKTKVWDPLPTVGGVDLKRYAGKWYEVTRLPNRFQNDGCKATAEYTAQADGSIKVVNRELCLDGKNNEVVGRATPVPGSQNARLRVKFGGLAALAPSPKDGNYWIIKLADDYSVSLVGTPDRKYLWLLAREPKVDEKTLNAYVEGARVLGFDTSKLLRVDR